MVLISSLISVYLRVYIVSENSEFYLKKYIVTLKYLFVYPIVFPVLLYKNKMSFAHAIANEIYNDLKAEDEDFKLSRKELKEIVYNGIKFYSVMSLWLNLNWNIFRNYRKYIDFAVVNAVEYVDKHYESKKYSKESLKKAKAWVVFQPFVHSFLSVDKEEQTILGRKENLNFT